MDQSTVLIISDAPEFSRAITGRWQAERSVPAFTLTSSDVALSFDPDHFQLAIAGYLKPQSFSAVLQALDAAGKCALFVAADSTTLQTVQERWARILTLQAHDHWLDTLILVATASLHRAIAERRAARAEQATAHLQRQATLGRYMLEMRHSLNNALTSVLGNSELLLLEPGSLSADARSQIETVRNMALRIHEILQRFSSLEKELTVAERQSGHDVRASHIAAAV